MTEINQQIAAANRAYFALKDVMKSTNVHWNTKVSLYIRQSSELYYVMAARHGPCTTGGEEMALAAFEWKILRKIFGPCIFCCLSHKLHFNC
jgi:hypothetical protein